MIPQQQLSDLVHQHRLDLEASAQHLHLVKAAKAAARTSRSPTLRRRARDLLAWLGRFFLLRHTEPVPSRRETRPAEALRGSSHVLGTPSAG